MYKAFNNLIIAFSNILTIFDDPDKIEITEKEIDYYNNYYLKGIKHKDFS